MSEQDRVVHLTHKSNPNPETDADGEHMKRVLADVKGGGVIRS